MKTKVVELLNSSLNPAFGQSNHIYFSGLSDDYKQVNSFSNCKAYMQDGYYRTMHPDNNNAWEAIGNGTLSMKSFKLLLAMKGLDKKIHDIVHLIHQIETKLKITPTKVYAIEAANKDHEKFTKQFFLLEANKKWLISTPMISFYTLLCRIASNNRRGTYVNVFKNVLTVQNAYDKEQLRQALNGIFCILKNGDKVFGTDLKENYSKNYMSTSHGAGIVEFSQGNLQQFPRWYKYYQKKKNYINISTLRKVALSK